MIAPMLFVAIGIVLVFNVLGCCDQSQPFLASLNTAALCMLVYLATA